jgi:hypothetical protein
LSVSINERGRNMSKRETKEEKAKREARKRKECVSYIDRDDTEITVTPQGHVFFNVTEWY